MTFNTATAYHLLPEGAASIIKPHMGARMLGDEDKEQECWEMKTNMKLTAGLFQKNTGNNDYISKISQI